MAVAANFIGGDSSGESKGGEVAVERSTHVLSSSFLMIPARYRRYSCRPRSRRRYRHGRYYSSSISWSFFFFFVGIGLGLTLLPYCANTAINYRYTVCHLLLYVQSM